MGKTNSLASLIVASLAVGLGVSGCGGDSTSSSGGTVSGLSLPSSMSVVAASGGTSPAHVQSAGLVHPAGLTSATFAATADYSTDTAHAYVFDDSMRSLQTVNMILCLMDQTHASDLVNSGPYYALINEAKCQQGQNQSSAGSTGQSSGSIAQLNKWTIDSTRASSTDPMIVHMWVPGGAGGSDPMDNQRIMVDLTATTGVSSSEPFGAFDLMFKGVIDGAAVGQAGVDVQSMAGSLSASGLEFQYANIEGVQGLQNGRNGSEAAHVIYSDAGGSSGEARTSSSQSGGGNGSSTSNYGLAFNSTNVLSTDMNASVDTCLARDSFTTHVWRYNLYYRDSDAGAGHTAGQRVTLNSGFPFTYVSGNDTLNGFVGYNGVWAEDNANIPDGASITRTQYGNSNASPQTYTVHVSDGKLIKRERQTLPLSKLVSQTLYYWGVNPSNSQYGQWAVAVDGSNHFSITASVAFGGNGPVNTPVSPTVDITPTVDGQNLWLWADSLGGNVVYVYNSVAVTPDVTFYAESFAQPDDAALFGSASSISVYCYDRCLKGGLTQNDIGVMSSESDLYYPSNGTAYVYTLQSASGKLALLDTQNSNAAVSAVGLNLSGVGHDWGAQTGEMVLSTVGITNPWDVYSKDTTYRWETGDNAYNRLTTVTDAQDVIATFDRPLHFTYTVAAGDDLNDDAHAGNTYMLEYGGPGELHGFPWVEADSGRWYSEVNLRDGVELTDTASAAVMVVRPVEMEQTMNVAGGGCGTLNSSAAQALSILSEPSGSVSFTWADKPVPTSEAPAVIDGVLQ